METKKEKKLLEIIERTQRLHILLYLLIATVFFGIRTYTIPLILIYLLISDILVNKELKKLNEEKE